VLELGVGTGRIAVPIAAAGVHVVASTCRRELDVARERADLAAVEVDLPSANARPPSPPTLGPAAGRCAASSC